MTKKELEKEVEKFLGGWLIDPEIVKLLVDFAEPREKQIQIDAEQIRALQKQNGELTDKLTKAKELIKTLLLIADNKVSQMEFQLCVADAKQFLKDSEVEK